MSDRTYKFGDVVEWDIYGGKVIRWFIICGEPGNYKAWHVATIGGKSGKKWEYEDGRIVLIGVGGPLTDMERGETRVLTDG